METGLRQRGVAQRALKHLAKGEGGEGSVPFPSELPPQSDISPHGWRWGREREEQRLPWILVEDSVGPWQRGRASFSRR